MSVIPRSLKGQLIAATLLAVLISQVLAIGVLLSDRKSAIYANWLRNIVVRTGAFIELMEATPSQFHEQILKASATGSVRFSVASEPTVEEGSVGDDALAAEFRELLGDRAEVIAFKVYPGFDGTDRLRLYVREWFRDVRSMLTGSEAPGGRAPRHIHTRLSIKLKDGRWLNVTVAPRPSAPPAWPLVVQMLATAILAWLAIIIVINRMTKPLKKLAAAASALGRGQRTQGLVEEGPSEVAETIRAFNDMQERLTRFVYDRTKMLAAIGHDLRTPITSLRLRAEFVDDEETRTKILETLDEMQEMAEATLSFAREEGAQEETRLVDVSALVSSVCADLADTGKDVTVTEFEPLTLRCRPMALKRALRNIVENAVAYGQEAAVSLERSDGDAVIHVDDTGPGIPAHDMERVFKPFVRLETSRSRETGGVGLGLAIARSIMRGHGGDIILRNRTEGGLRVTLVLPATTPAEKIGAADRVPPMQTAREHSQKKWEPAFSSEKAIE